VYDVSVEYDKHGRMKYNPYYHSEHGHKMTEEELEYLCRYWDIDGVKTMAMALGKTEKTLQSKVNLLKKNGKFEYYKNLNRYW